LRKDIKSAHVKGDWPLWRLILTGLNILALFLSIILSWHFFKGGTMIGCGGGSPCQQVLNSQWSVIADVFPISGLAVGVYMALLAASFFISSSNEAPIQQMAWKIMVVLAGTIAGSAIWFTILQKWFIGDFCPYCMSAHVTGLLLASLIIWRALKRFSDAKINRMQVAGLALTGLIIAGIMAVIQLSITPTVTYREGKSAQNYLPAIDYRNAPIVGSPEAPYIVTLLFDYQCSHCQKIHFMLDEAVRTYNGKLAFALSPAPLNTGCNPFILRDVDAFKNSCELARIGLAVWRASREKFPVFENWMFTFESGDGWYPRGLEATKAKAIGLVGEDAFTTAMSDPWIDEYIQKCVQIYGQTLQNGQGGIPKIIFGSLWVIPQPANADELVTILQNSLALPKP
jgi:uncharacterized membrane protein/protein-disulfide isomerase